MTNCFKCGKVLPGNLCPGEYIMCKECQEKFKKVANLQDAFGIGVVSAMALGKSFGWVFTPKAKDCLTIELTNRAIVFCRDCAYWQDNNGGYPHPECRWGHEETPDSDDYCSYGVRRDGDV